MQLRILGAVELLAGRLPVKVGGPREHIVLAALALNVNRVTSIEHLIDAVWDDQPPSTARGQIQGCVSALRKLFSESDQPDAISTRSAGYVLNLGPEDLDSEHFGQLVAQARVEADAERSEEAADTLRTALDLWRGPALDGVRSELVRRGAAKLEDARLSAIDERVRLDLELGRHREIIGELRALSAEYPLREQIYCFLALALYRSGMPAEALETCRRARKTLINEMGIEPGQELRELAQALLNRSPSLDVPAGNNRTNQKDQHASPRQLPSSIADFIGREHQVVEITKFLANPESTHSARFAVPVAVISGRGGIGKSTLALRVAHELSDAYPDGHIYVDLHGPGGSATVPALLARFLRALGVSGSGIPTDTEERAELYRSKLAGKRLLLVLDDVTCESQVRALLPGSPSCAVIVTSRRRLCGLAGAHPVELDAFDELASMELLARIVGDARLQAEPEAARELVKYCGGLPVALRIAGARLASRPHWRIAQLARRLKDEVHRLDEFSHQGLELRSSIGLSYRSLTEPAQRLFRLMSLIQAPDFPAWAAAALLDMDLTDAEDLLESLVDAQMLDTVQGPTDRTRYRFHDLIRVFAKEQALAVESPQERCAAVVRVLGGWLDLAEQAHRSEYGGDFTILHGSAPRWHVADAGEPTPTDNPLEYLEGERAGLIAAVRQAATEDLAEMCWDLALSAVSVFEVKGYFDDWRETSQLALDTARRAGNRTGEAAMRYSLGTLSMVRKQFTAASRHFDAAMELFEADGNVHGQALVLRNAAVVDRFRGDLEAMNAKYERALASIRTVGDLVGEANVLRRMAKFRIDEGQTTAASDLLDQALTLCRRADYRRGQAQVLSTSADLYLSTGELQRARGALTDVLCTVREIGDRTGEAHALYGLGVVRRREGRLGSAETTLAQAVAVAEEVGDRMIEAQARYLLGDLAIARGEAGSAASHLERASATFADLGAALWHARTLLLLSEVDQCAGDVGKAGSSLDAAAELLTGIESNEALRLLEQLQIARSALAGATVGTGRSDQP
ncbi:AfsR/SARP family transcriptional regulator [Labedaea rhizosphaerae]|uniref:DNA-binding SARP family transcriptional activator n=1 Tax=Labedaea rhizosphaerae TaxID=598644 RepID=A0A4R6SHX4_LABRH|nr:AfsR/SARP family transcriptional regulator [Labedaea rhizosphaerae]TDQ00469.1 DNA-binding SARP family transcriptional activator [Labedaea rhizosphaerae]